MNDIKTDFKVVWCEVVECKFNSPSNGRCGKGIAVNLILRASTEGKNWEIIGCNDFEAV